MQIRTVVFAGFFQNVRVSQKASSGFRYMNPSRLAGRLHFIGERDVVRPDVEFEPPPADDAAQYGTGVNADSHVDVFVFLVVEFGNRLDHACISE
ncbi:unnamed protein product, partial [Nesidiocoris tenuis]